MSENSQKEQVALAEALLDCESMKTQGGREDISILLGEIHNRIKIGGTALSHVLNIVRACVGMPGTSGIDSLIDEVAVFERQTGHWPYVLECAAALKARMVSSSPEADPDLVPDRGTPDQPLKDASALVIGIGKYKQDRSDSPDGAESFPNLKFPTDDARCFHAFLKESGCHVPEPLLDEQATRARIMRALDDLCVRSRRSLNSTVLIFFSGHGARDGEGRHYLVPHDGMRNDLFATAMLSDTFKQALRLLRENARAVMIVDACHAGAISETGVKGWQAYSPESLVEDAKKQCILASCKAEEISLEENGHGIYSRHLLEVLGWKGVAAEQTDEQIDVSTLHKALSRHVSDVTFGKQTPWSNVVSETNVVLAVNGSRRQKRWDREYSVLDRVEAELANRYDRDQALREELIRCIPTGLVDTSNMRVYRLYRKFQQTGLELHPNKLDSQEFKDFCEKLIELHKGESRPTTTRENVGARPTYAAPATPAEQVATPAVSPQQSSMASKVEARPAIVDSQERSSASAIGAATSPEMRCLWLEDVERLLEKMKADPSRVRVAGIFEKLLSDSVGVNLRKVSSFLGSLYQDGADEWNLVLEETGVLFKDEIWPKAYKPTAWTFSAGDIDFATLGKRVRKPASALDEWLAPLIPAIARDPILGAAPGDVQKQRTLLGINSIVHGPSIWDEQRFAGVVLRPGTEQLRAKEPRGEQIAQVNRMLLEDAYPVELKKKEVLTVGLAARFRVPNG